MDLIDLIAASGGLLTGVAGLVVAIAERSKRKSDYSSQISAAALILVNPLAKRIEELEAAMQSARKTIGELEGKLDQANETIQKQSLEMAELRKENRELKLEQTRLRKENEELCKQLMKQGGKASQRSFSAVRETPADYPAVPGDGVERKETG